MLRVRNIESGYGALRVLRGVSLHVGRGEIVAIIGANGAGKTTLLNTIAGVIRPSGGKVFFDQRPVTGLAPERMALLGCALVPEGRQLFSPMTVRENLLMGACARPCANRADRERLFNAVLDLFPALRPRLRQPAGTLSGGEQQMVAIGRALMAEPAMIMMDEPSMGLAPLVVTRIFETIARLRDEGRTVLLVEQNARAALRVADRGYVLETGRIVLEGASSELLANNDVQRAYLGKDYKSIAE